MILLPMLTFDKNGYRVGYGKGFYDRFCALCKPGTRFIGLSLFEPVDAIDDVNEYDVWMHSCLTPFGRWDWH
jgi:5-formyltetrahydrofolate cyclo-ligase